MRERESVVQQPSSVAGVGWTLDRAVVVVYSKPVRCRDARCSTARPPRNETKSVDPDNTAELFAGTTACHELAAGFLGPCRVRGVQAILRERGVPAGSLVFGGGPQNLLTSSTCVGP